MNRRRLGRAFPGLVVGALVAETLLAVVGVGGPVGVVAAQTGPSVGVGGLDAAIQGVVAGWGPAGGAVLLLAGVVVLTAATEKLIDYLARASLGLQTSLFALAIVFTGFEFDDTVVALVFSAGHLQGVALGTALGTALAVVGVTLALAAIVHPFPVDVPTDYLLLLGLTPLVLVPLALLGTLSLVHGVFLLVVCALLFGYLVVRERDRETPVFRSSDLGEAVRPDGGAGAVALPEIPEARFLGRFSTSGWAWLALAVVALLGIVFASTLLEAGSRRLIEGFGLGQTVFGATVLTAVLTFEDVVLTIEPVRRGVPEIGVGNVIGSVLFSVTGNVGVVALASHVTISRSVLTFHLPALVLVTAVGAYFLSTGRMERRHGLLLAGLYVVYWTVAVVVFGGVPLSA